jgi:hypothetical protein
LGARALDVVADLLTNAKSPRTKIACIRLLVAMRASDRRLLETLVKVRTADAEWEKHCRNEEFARMFRLALSGPHDGEAG